MAYLAVRDLSWACRYASADSPKCTYSRTSLVPFVLDKSLEELTRIHRRLFCEGLMVQDGRGGKARKRIYLDDKKFSRATVRECVHARVPGYTDFFCQPLDMLADFPDHRRLHDGRRRGSEVYTGPALELFLDGEDLALSHRYRRVEGVNAPAPLNDTDRYLKIG